MAEWKLRRMTWPEIPAAGRSRRRVVLVPVGHRAARAAPAVDTDNLAVEAIGEQAARSAPDLLVLAPPVHDGENEHNMNARHGDGGPFAFVAYCRDIALPLRPHGFDRVLFIRGRSPRRKP